MDYTKIEKLGYLMATEAYQNEDSLGNCLDLREWITPFTEWLKTEKSELYEKIPTDLYEDLEEALVLIPFPENGVTGLEVDLLMAWAEWISIDERRYNELGEKVYDYFIYDGQAADFYYWLPGGGPKELKEAVEWCKELWPTFDWSPLNDLKEPIDGPMMSGEELINYLAEVTDRELVINGLISVLPDYELRKLGEKIADKYRIKINEKYYSHDLS